MRTPTSRQAVIVIAATLVVVVIAGCGRRADLAGDNGSIPTSAAAVTTASPRQTTAPLHESAGPITSPPADPSANPATEPATEPAATPVPTPDLSSIEALLSGIDTDLGDDANAAANEGSPQ